MKREYAVIGLGRFGAGVALALAQHGHTVVGVDNDREIVQELSSQLTDVVHADATDEAALKLLGVNDFDSVVVAIGDFESSLLSVVSLKHLGIANVIAKALTRRQAEILLKIGANEVVLPEQEAGERLALRLSPPSVNQALLEFTGLTAGERPVPPEWLDRSVGDLRIRQEHGVLAIAIRRGTELLVAPGPDDVFKIEDRVVFIGSLERLQALGCRINSHHV